MRKILLLITMAVLSMGTAFSQGSPFSGSVANGQGQPIAGALITACNAGATGAPCSPTITIYSDAALTHPITTLTTDGYGYFQFFVPAGNYCYTATSPQITSTTCYPFAAPLVPGSVANFASVTTTGNISAGGNISATGTVTGSNIPAGTINTGTGTTNALVKYTNGATGVTGNADVTDDGNTLSVSDSLSVTASTGLGATAGTGDFRVVGGLGTPHANRTYCGDGSGWQCEWAKRTGSVDTIEAFLTDGGVFNIATGYRVNGGAGSGHVLRGNGTNFVDSSLAASDLSNGTSGSGSVCLTTGCALSSPSTTGTDSGTERLQNKRNDPRIVTLSTSTTFTPDSDNSDETVMNMTGVAGTITIAAPTGTPTDGQKLIIRLKTTNAQTYSFNATYRFSTSIVAPTATTATKTDYIGCIWNALDTKWDVVAVDQGH
jgi:hypothetical protein